MRAVRIAHPEERTVTYQAVTRAIQSVYLDNCADAQVAVPELLDGAILLLNFVQRMNSGFRDCIRHCALFVYIGAGINKPYTGVTRSFCLGLPDVLLVAYEHIGLLEDIPMDVTIGNASLLIAQVTARDSIHTEVKSQVMEHIWNRALEEVLEVRLRSNDSLYRAEKGFVTLIVIRNACNPSHNINY
jgi:hypothetical protein